MVVNLYMNETTNGPGKVVSNLKKGMYELNIDVNINPPLSYINEDTKTYCIQNIKHVVESDKRHLITFGPNLCVLPSEIPEIMLQDYRKFIVNSEWTYNLYKRFLSVDKLDIWTVGIDTELFRDTKNDSKNIDCLLYYKNRSKTDLNYIISILDAKKQSYILIEYGKYKEIDFIDTISKSKYCIMLNNTESQGIAIQEIMSSNLPMFVWDYTIWDYLDITNHIESTSCPYWTDICGVKVDTNISQNFDYFLENINAYNPREYIVDNFTLKKGAENLIKI